MFPASICAIRVLIALVRLVLLVQFAVPGRGVEEYLVKGEEELPSAHLLRAGFFSGNPGDSFPQSAHHWPHLHGDALDGGGILRVSPVHFVQRPEFGFEGRILGRVVLLFDREVVFFALLLVTHSLTRALMTVSKLSHKGDGRFRPHIASARARHRKLRGRRPTAPEGTWSPTGKAAP